MRPSISLCLVLAGAAGVPCLGQCTPGATNFCVTTGVETAGNLNPGPSDLGEVFYIDGVESPVLTLERGRTYTFTMNGVGVRHLFYISTSSVGFGSPEYTDGVAPTGGVTGFEVLTFAVPQSAPNSLYYVCFGHQNMGWLLNIVTPTPTCYANCDLSTIPPVLNVLDFNCFLNAFASGASYANCDDSTIPPVLNVLDFNCFLNRFAAGCP
jgi:hypothetical protein